MLYPHIPVGGNQTPLCAKNQERKAQLTKPKRPQLIKPEALLCVLENSPRRRIWVGARKARRRGSVNFRYETFMTITLGGFGEHARPFADESKAKARQG